jgi:rhodanese-related sulfurtransferase
MLGTELGLSDKSKVEELDLSAPERITQAELADMIKHGQDFLLIDVRTEKEHEMGHLPGAIVIPYSEFESRYKEILDYKDREIVLYCHTGGMGDYAGKVLFENGFDNVKNLEGGIIEWINKGGELVSGAEKPQEILLISESKAGLSSLNYWGSVPEKKGCEEVEEKYTELHNYSYPFLVREAIKGEVLPVGVPKIYGEELEVSFDGDTDTMTTILSRFEDHPLNDEQMKRYLDIGLRISCEYCCGVNALIFENGERACGCAHSYAMRGLAKYLLINHGEHYKNEAILLELGKWKATFFPKQTIAKAVSKYSELGDLDPSILVEMPNMVGRC